MISIHALREEGDWRFLRGFHRQIDFYPRPPRGGRRWTMALCPLLNYFYPRPPRGGRPECLDLPPQTFEFLSTPSARRATIHPQSQRRHDMISIHALREEGDWRFLRGFHRQIDFYPRPPRGGRRWTMALCPLLNYFYPRPPRGGRPECLDLPPQTFEFLSTPSARRATPPLQRPGRPDQNFYPRPPRGGRQTQ